MLKTRGSSALVETSADHWAGTEIQNHRHLLYLLFTQQEQQRDTGVESERRRYPTRERRSWRYLDDYVSAGKDSDKVRFTVDYCVFYTLYICGILQIYEVS